MLIASDHSQLRNIPIIGYLGEETHRFSCRRQPPFSIPSCSRGSCRSWPFPPPSFPAHRETCKRNPSAWFALARIPSARRIHRSNKRSDRSTEPAHFPVQSCCLQTEVEHISKIDRNWWRRALRASYLPKIKVYSPKTEVFFRQNYIIGSYIHKKICQNDLASSLLNVLRENSLFNTRRIETDVIHIKCQSSLSDFMYIFFFFATPRLYNSVLKRVPALA